jgi:hypothetical protein
MSSDIALKAFGGGVGLRTKRGMRQHPTPKGLCFGPLPYGGRSDGLKPWPIRPHFHDRSLRGVLKEDPSTDALWAWPKEGVRLRSIRNKRLRMLKHILRRNLHSNDIRIITRLTRSSWERFLSLVRRFLPVGYDRKVKEDLNYFYLYDRGVRTEFSAPTSDDVMSTYYGHVDRIQKETGLTRFPFTRVAQKWEYTGESYKDTRGEIRKVRKRVWKPQEYLPNDRVIKSVPPVRENQPRPLLRGGGKKLAPPATWKHVSSPFCDCYRCEYCDLTIAELKSYDDCIIAGTTELWVDPRIMRNQLRPLPHYEWGQV